MKNIFNSIEGAHIYRSLNDKIDNIEITMAAVKRAGFSYLLGRNPEDIVEKEEENLDITRRLINI